MSQDIEILEVSVFVRVWTVAHELADEGKLALFDETESELLVLNSLGAAVWTRLDGERSLGDLAAEIASEVQGAPSQAEVFQAIKYFLTGLLGRGAIRAS